MNKQRNVVATILIYAILLGVFNLLVFTIFKLHTSVFWISYVFMTLAFIIQITSVFLSFKTSDVETAFFGIPLFSLSIYYLCAEIVIGALFMIFQAYAGFTLALVLQVVFLATFLIVAILAVISRDTVQDINQKREGDINRLKSVLIDVEMMRDTCMDSDTKELLRKLSEIVKYSDPISSESVADVEQRILSKVFELRTLLENNQFEEAKQYCNTIQMLYVERNKKLSLAK